MARILLASLKQETATFNPVPTRYDSFQVVRGPEILRALAGTHTEVAGAVEVIRSTGSTDVVPAVAAWSLPGGPVTSEALDRLIGETLESARSCGPVDAACLILHGAMAGEDEPDPEGRLLEGVREILGPRPIVASLDLHAVLTDRMVRSADCLVPFHTYPHTDQYDTGRRAARVALGLLDGSISPTSARVELPMLVRGDELLTATGRFGRAIRLCRELEDSDCGVSAGVIIGNPFTDVPDLQSNVLVTTNADQDRARREAENIARLMWESRHAFVAELTPLDDAVSLDSRTCGLTVFSDAADATASGAPGDSNQILRGLIDLGYSGRSLVPIVDAPAVRAAFEAGVGGCIATSLGGTRDPGRHTPLPCTVYVESLSDGCFVYEDGTSADAGGSAVLRLGAHHILATARPVGIVGRRVFLAHGLDPQDFDLVVVKSPNGFRTHYASIADRIVPVDVPGATSADLRALPYTRCVRPIFPLDADARPPFPTPGS